MKCPKCNSKNTQKVYVSDPNWHLGHQRCNSCFYQDDWLKFCDPPITIRLSPELEEDHKKFIKWIEDNEK